MEQELETMLRTHIWSSHPAINYQLFLQTRNTRHFYGKKELVGLVGHEQQSETNRNTSYNRGKQRHSVTYIPK